MDEPKKKLNQLDGRSWTRYSLSVWDDIRRESGEINVDHPAVFPGGLVRRLLEIYTRPDDCVMDPFMGSGTVLLEAYRSGRRGLGLEISPKYVEMVYRRLEQLQEAAQESYSDYIDIYRADARSLSDIVPPESVDFCLTSPPYWDVLNQKRSADKKDIANYGGEKSDLGEIVDYQAFLEELGVVFTQLNRVLKHSKYCAVVVMDLRKGSSFYPLHMDLVFYLRRAGFKLEDIIIWDRKSEYNNLRPLGYPYVFRVNKVHEYIMLFSKTGTGS